MKEELQGKLVEILTSIQSAAGAASNFAMEQLPDIAQSYVVYGRATTTFYVIAGIIGLIACFWGAHVFEKAKRNDRSFPHGMVYFFLGLVGLIFPGGAVVANIGEFFLVWVAPKVWLLREIATMLK